ncbi:MAG TPA: DNA double-strand break repair nuclease NurA [Acidimicrobiales bacterium]|nr:DNA double-strand break repair nuclease NurA [Acidimicrobiales bacterium]
MQEVAQRLAKVLTGGGDSLADPTGSDLLFETVIGLRPLVRSAPPADVWAVDGGQALVADARCLQVVVTRAARVRYRDGECVFEDDGELAAELLTDGSVINLLRDQGEWRAVEDALAEAEPGALILIDGDLQPDWRIPSTFLAGLMERAANAQVTLAAVTKHSSLSRGGAPLLGHLEREAEALFGERSMWWAPVARTRPDLPVDIQVVAARLDPDAPFSFRIDLPGDVDPEPMLAAISALCDDAAFPGYPYPLTVADRLAACPGWLRAEAAGDLDDALAALGVSEDIRRRAFTDRHRLMERS